MAFRLTFGIDPGQSGSIALLADGEAVWLCDMPTMARKAGGHEVNATALAQEIRCARALHPGAFTLAVMERVSAMPKQGLASTFRFGQSDGIVRGVLGALGVGMIDVPAVTWKRHHGLLGADKDAARGMAIQRFPRVASQLHRKKDVGRADALLIALWAEQTEQVPMRAQGSLLGEAA